MNALIVKSIIGVLGTCGTAVGGWYIFDHVIKNQTIENKSNNDSERNKNDNEKNVSSTIDIFVSSKEITLGSTSGDRNEIECQFKNLTEMHGKFACEVFSSVEGKNIVENTSIKINEFTKKHQNTHDSLNKGYYRINVDKSIWDKWSAKENQNKTVIIHISNTTYIELTLLFGVYGNEIQRINVDSRTLQEYEKKQIRINEIQFFIA